MWARAYVEQARSDWDTGKVVTATKGCAACHWLHYLQMTTEKLGKAALLRSGGDLEAIKTSHKAFVRFLRVAARSPSLRQMLGYNVQQLKAYVDEVLPIAEGIERLAPALAQQGPNAEYPWETPAGAIVAPASHNFSVLEDLRKPQGRKLLRLILRVLDNFDAIF